MLNLLENCLDPSVNHHYRKALPRSPMALPRPFSLRLASSTFPPLLVSRPSLLLLVGLLIHHPIRECSSIVVQGNSVNEREQPRSQPTKRMRPLRKRRKLNPPSALGGVDEVGEVADRKNAR